MLRLMKPTSRVQIPPTTAPVTPWINACSNAVGSVTLPLAVTTVPMKVWKNVPLSAPPAAPAMVWPSAPKLCSFEAAAAACPPRTPVMI